MNKKILIVSLASLMSLQSCGMILHPERINAPRSNKVDVSILLLDSLGLLFFIIPGGISFACDLVTGTMFLPEDKEVQLDAATLKALRQAAEKSNNDGIHLDKKSIQNMKATLAKKGIQVTDAELENALQDSKFSK